MLFGICSTFNIFTIPNNYMHFIFTDWIRGEGEWFLWWGSFRLLNRSQYTTQQFHTAQLCGCDNLCFEMSKGIFVPQQPAFIQIWAPLIACWKKNFKPALSKKTTKTNDTDVHVVCMMFLHNLIFTCSCKVIPVLNLLSPWQLIFLVSIVFNLWSDSSPTA